jgi:hypothetical protein
MFIFILTKFFSILKFVVQKIKKNNNLKKKTIQRLVTAGCSTFVFFSFVKCFLIKMKNIE